jgi:hypothetical protein
LGTSLEVPGGETMKMMHGNLRTGTSVLERYCKHLCGKNTV